MKKERLVAFTDAVLAIIMTILVLDLRKPDEASIQAFISLRWNFFAYTLSFFWLGSLWMGINAIWDKAEYINNKTVFWTLILLFLASFIPYSTNLVAENFDSSIMQGFYGINVILMTSANYRLHQVLDEPNKDNPELLKATSAYRRILIPDILIKCAGLLISIFVWPPAMMFAVLAAAAIIISSRSQAFHDKGSAH